VGEAQQPLRSAVRPQRVQQDAQATIEHQVEPKRVSALPHLPLDARERPAAGEGDQHETEGFVELHGMFATAVTAPGEEASHAADPMTDRERDGEVVRSAHEVEPAGRGEGRAAEGCAGEPAEEDEADPEVGPEAKLATRVVLPAEREKQRLGTDHGAEKQRPHGRPELVLGDAETRAVALEPQHRGHAPAGREQPVRGGDHAALPAMEAAR
jgi:hypothetical protein